MDRPGEPCAHAAGPSGRPTGPGSGAPTGRGLWPEWAGVWRPFSPCSAVGTVKAVRSTVAGTAVAVVVGARATVCRHVASAAFFERIVQPPVPIARLKGDGVVKVSFFFELVITIDDCRRFGFGFD